VNVFDIERLKEIPGHIGFTEATVFPGAGVPEHCVSQVLEMVKVPVVVDDVE
jgi:hypothetical protein